MTDNKASGHNLQWTKAMISKPAPHWEGTAVHNGAMKELKLTDFKGKYLVCSLDLPWPVKLSYKQAKDLNILLLGGNANLPIF